MVAQQGLPTVKLEQIEGAPEQRPQAPARFARATLLIEAISKLQKLMGQKGQEVEQIKDPGESLLAVPIVVLDFVAMFKNY